MEGLWLEASWPVPAPVTPRQGTNGHVASPASARPGLQARWLRLSGCPASGACGNAEPAGAQACPLALRAWASWPPGSMPSRWGCCLASAWPSHVRPTSPCSTQDRREPSGAGVRSWPLPDPAGRTAAAALSSEGHETDWSLHRIHCRHSLFRLRN